MNDQQQLNDQMAVATIHTLSAGMLIFFTILAIAGVVVAAVYFLLLHRTMDKVALAQRPVPGWTIWLSYIPVAGPIWSVVFAVMLSSSIKKDFLLAGRPDHKDGALPFAIGMAVALLCAFIPFVNLIGGPAYLVLWIIYWVKIAEISKRMPVIPVVSTAIPPAFTSTL